VEKTSYTNSLGDLVSRREKEQREKYEKNYEAKDNFVYIIQGKIALEATEDKIIVLMDKFRSGYECSTCKGSGVGTICPDCKSGFNNRGFTCKTCEGDYRRWEGKDCPTCKGRGSIILIPDSAKSLPTSGTIVSAGPKCVSRRISEKVIFGAHVGFFLPFKGNVRLRIMREHEILCTMYLLEESEETKRSLGDFYQIDEQINNEGDL
jgi:co-chaperonin GroES (HSP10)